MAAHQPTRLAMLTTDNSQYKNFEVLFFTYLINHIVFSLKNIYFFPLYNNHENHKD